MKAFEKGNRFATRLDWRALEAQASRYVRVCEALASLLRGALSLYLGSVCVRVALRVARTSWRPSPSTENLTSRPSSTSKSSNR